MNILSSVHYDGELSGWAYLVLAGMFLLIIGGLSWCFYRANKASSQQTGEQHPDEV